MNNIYDLGTGKGKGIQLTLLDYFMDSDMFTLKEATECVKQHVSPSVKNPSIRARIYEGIDKGLFQRVTKGVYTVTRKDSNNRESTAMLIQGSGRDLSYIKSNSIDMILCDHPYELSNLKGGNRNFAKYDKFCYNEHDFAEKARVLKDGCFMVEFLPEESADSYEYIYHVKEFAKKVGLEYYANVPWKKGDFVANTGRKSKNTENVMIFSKGKARSLRPDAKKNKQYAETHTTISYEMDLTPFFCDEDTPEEIYYLNLSVLKEQKDFVLKELDKAWDNWHDDCEGSILLDDETDADVLCQVPVGDYLLAWLDQLGIEYTDLDKEEAGLHYMSGANGMLPTVFDFPPVPKADKIHQAEKPVELIKAILSFLTVEGEWVLDQYSGSFSTAAGCIETKRNSISIELDEECYKKGVERLKQYEN